MFELLLFTVALIGSLACGIYDMKTSNVPDSVCVLMIASAILLHSFYGLSTGDFSYLINSFMFGGLFLAFSLLMYFTGQWGGGDGELLIAIGFLLPNLSFVSTVFPFAISFFINTFFIGAIYSILYSLFLAYRNPKIGKNFLDNIGTSRLSIFLLLIICISISFLLTSQIILAVLTFLIFVLIVFQRFSKTIEESFYRKIPSSQLRADDMLGEDIPRLRLYKKHIRGLTEEQVKRIRRFKRHVVVREGIRYGIVFPLSLIFTWFFGDFFLFFV